jgi:hypothetical protein
MMTKKKPIKCENCGHTHIPSENCVAAFCVVCGTGGDLTQMSCEQSRKTNAEIEVGLKLMKATGLKEVTWKQGER